MYRVLYSVFLAQSAIKLLINDNGSPGIILSYSRHEKNAASNNAAVTLVRPYSNFNIATLPVIDR